MKLTEEENVTLTCAVAVAHSVNIQSGELQATARRLIAAIAEFRAQLYLSEPQDATKGSP